ncbi:hypothetical protein IMG5_099600 [Ichthyophthirius multifiliis]|uniref:Large ribosomal subunit protein uL23 N-terminal domain-containing protein n=1 Tax=Ichthyophthirius multifiliis TaxID=5932 RepID=G0QS67_ICHMU|nr:hypothetical protein IMG5_099600 [Ichthyophthirius multifiliis]EGR31932.1 hypothetical protein IMG5_099600 [Ichthyophthirius multifiliis]|eukprot:XP_004035418.1 hypothetical protein IMG5_099600 [Ichthyophthirius multifiliis]
MQAENAHEDVIKLDVLVKLQNLIKTLEFKYGDVKNIQKKKKRKLAKDTKPTTKEQPKTVSKQGAPAAVSKATKVAKAAKKGTSVSSHKTHTRARFYRPKTLQLPRAPKYQRTVRAHLKLSNHLENHAVVKHPLTTEKAMKKMEDENTMVFLVHNRATKPQIKKAFEKLHNVKVRSINTLNTVKGSKKAYIRLSADCDSLSLASKIGII